MAVSNYGYTYEGVIAYADNIPNQNNTPVYRLRSPFGGYFYTIDRKERDLAVINDGYYSEGIGFYELRYSSNPIYRLMNPNNSIRLFTNSTIEKSLAVNNYGYADEGIGWYSY
jgi:hypothetical protein